MVTLNRYVTVSEASKRLKVDVRELYQHIDTGRIRAIKSPGGILVSEDDLDVTLPKEERPEYILFAHLSNVPITLNQASKKYGIACSTISRWIDKGYITVLVEREKRGQKILLNEQDIAYCAYVYKENRGRGKWVFNPDGTPYRKLT